MEAATTRRRLGRPAQISREQIVDAALSAGNLDTLTMRELVARLEVRHGALYRWVKNRDQLFDLISDVMVERITRHPDRIDRLSIRVPPELLLHRARITWHA
jgi:AcrR family transcriptional regulator